MKKHFLILNCRYNEGMKQMTVFNYCANCLHANFKTKISIKTPYHWIICEKTQKEKVATFNRICSMYTALICNYQNFEPEIINAMINNSNGD